MQLTTQLVALGQDLPIALGLQFLTDLIDLGRLLGAQSVCERLESPLAVLFEKGQFLVELALQLAYFQGERALDVGLRHGRRRSEERRVGKECRSGWSPDRETKGDERK